jgi:sulfide:quinone oxidoreductase
VRQRCFCTDFLSIRGVRVDFLSGPRPTGTFQEPSDALVAEKDQFGAGRRARWLNA